MANKLILKRSSVPAKVPLATDLEIGELAVNLADAKLYTKNPSGTVIELSGGSGGGSSVVISTTAPSGSNSGDLWWNSEEGKLKIYYTDADTSQWVDAFTASVGSSGGDVVGPTSSTNNAIALFDGASGKLIKDSGVLLSSLGGVGVVAVKTTLYSTAGAGTFTTDEKTLFAQVYCTGGGGGGGGADSGGASMSASGGGGGGGTAIRWYSAAELGENAAYTVGAGGTAGSVSGGNGGSGGTSTFTPSGTGVSISGSGGSGGIGTGSAYSAYNSVFNGGSGGAGSGGTIISNGIDGGTGFGYGTSTTAGSMMGGNGGSSFWGGGGNAPTRNNSAGSQAGTSATTEGSGGSGAVNNNNTSGVAGGAGAAGAIYIVEFLST